MSNSRTAAGYTLHVLFAEKKPMGRDQPIAQQAHIIQEFSGAFAIALAHALDLDPGLGQMRIYTQSGFIPRFPHRTQQ
jgi:hypothetical protein